ncbi:MAG TPA: hypothetical protein VNT26_18715 [Candidatus Sulfotelmatobacter sp.]|nr:hypothetical protein [Candidatus Sulfotelmatobacter sp.]HWI60095.1 hypothetical protein [Bacillota bacterium]
MSLEKPLDSLPLWGVFALTVGLVLLAVATSFWLGGRSRRRSEAAQKTPVGEMVAAMLGLLALLLAFTFSLAASRFDTRRSLVLDEANAIGTTWLRAGLLPEPQRTQVRQLLRQYLEVRLEGVRPGQLQQALARSEALQGQLWAQAVAVGQKEPGSIMVGLFITSLNELIDLHAKRIMFGVRTRIPASIWAALYLVALLSFGAMGYHVGLSGARKFFAILPLALTFAIVLLLIADLDRSQEGLFRVSQQALADLRSLMVEQSP